jgi:hypothetical protein
VQKPVGGSLGDCGVFDVFAENACALLNAASKEISASVAVGFRLAMLFFLRIKLGIELAIKIV